MANIRQDRNDETQSVLELLRRVAQLTRNSARPADENGLTDAEHLSLSKLAERDEVSLNELAKRMMRHQSSVSIIVTRLVGRGMVRRAQAKQDKRRHELTVTTAGRKALRRTRREVHAKLHSALRRLSLVELRRLARLLRRVLDAIEQPE